MQKQLKKVSVRSFAAALAVAEGILQEPHRACLAMIEKVKTGYLLHIPLNKIINLKYIR